MKTAKKRSIKPAAEVVASPREILPGGEGSKSLWNDPFVHVLLILGLGFIVYFNSISVPFIFDDSYYLVNNPAIKNFDCFPDTRKVYDYAILTDIKNNLILRPVAYFTFAINYALHGLDLFGYHLVNMLLHIGCGMLVYNFFVRLMRISSLADEENNGTLAGIENTNFLPLFAALLFISHPLQTQAVTYLIQRFVPLATFFYLVALVLYLQFRHEVTSAARILTYILSLTAVVLAMESKEIAFTLPVLIVLVEFMFFNGNIVPRLVILGPFLLTMAIIPAKIMMLSTPVSTDKLGGGASGINLVNFDGISSWDYLMTQFGVIITYIRLLFLPIGQNFDYDYPLQQDFFKLEVLLPLALLLIIVGAGFYLLINSKENRLYKIIALGIFWFFITLSVESSIVPIEDLIFEHRAYLPSVGFFISFIASVSVIFYRLTGKALTHSKIATLLLLSIIVVLSTAAIARNRVWQDEVAFWNDVVKKSPKKARAYAGLGGALIQQSKYVPGDNDKKEMEDMMLLKAGSEKQIHAAINAFREAIRIEPKNSVYYRALAVALMFQKNYDEALRSLSIASELQPNSAISFVIRGEIYEAKGDLGLARQEYHEAVKKEPSAPAPHKKLADLYIKTGDYLAARKELEFLMQVYPDDLVRKKLLTLKNM